jgi:hypothetical protein
MIMNICEIWKTWQVPLVSAPVLAVSAPQMQATVASADQTIALVKGVLQIILLVGTIAFTLYQGLRARGRWKREKDMAQIVKEAHSECPKAQGGECPLAKRLHAYDNPKA